ncbi:MAG: selenobiotic family radical SAM modification target peptide [Desulfarculaceae bacterium]|nr:selenobiotic family radical SAM modification target peptide [Desulfarculaceae bacterium]MCF8073780.1 selenobiotic family radical SAM modification target peptide [Desulfarculaceae bacterium]MCF8102021.1 selenobiotic family radical SAM modification target peptide [Desulfarculaceae bacterium]MCF8115991.1 selenobiotic family radical SAM modification target peptide [Desulfarculaceae bacterium]
MESKQLKKILAGLCITGLVSGVGLMGCGGAAACAGIPPTKEEKPKTSSHSGATSVAAKPIKASGS